MPWRFSANHTHLYPGSLLRNLEAPGRARLSPGDEILVEFSDGEPVTGRLLEVDESTVLLQMPAYRTQRGTTVECRTWSVVAADEPGRLRVQKRLLVA
ncbi:hypothetical protein FHX59_001030 [Paraburkholderia silvatlantica]|uniref:Uncharacterized protein n=1 Tax=Paraburkholderia silvatlantica TaxID=321895 RepID=A0A2U1AMT7_9BURK|nr:hypothetical protein [Paraburkholderia silvatlantica]PVY37743.1 hypothetical protein C7411_101360 [Paraburkholderia silvatlantica]PXW42707.1 hypothetical protein C7413_101362 [Paraburkholderia silvatlantica]PYE13209.1 hypothetical protein C7410_14824 [Paraburkholderia silvatlantica]TDR04877.1 hypothetical protein C7412_101122 [Paraburkholderia silvatlantica]